MTVRGRESRLEDKLASLTDPRTLRFERAFAARPWAVPQQVKLEGDKLVWWTPVGDASDPEAIRSLPESERYLRLGAPLMVVSGPRLLSDFVRLHRESAEAIREFAGRWGPLGICEHGLPHTHFPRTPWNQHFQLLERRDEPVRILPDGAVMIPEVFRVLREICQPLGSQEMRLRGGWEPIERWRYFSEEAELILRTAWELHEHGGWATVNSCEADRLLSGTGDAESVEPQGIDWRWVRAAIDRWLGLGDVRPGLQYVPGDVGKVSVLFGTVGSPSSTIDLMYGGGSFHFDNVCGLFGALATELLLASSASTGIAFCSHCRSAYDPGSRAPAKNRRRFCPDCRAKGVPNMYAARDLRRRPAAKGRSKRSKRSKEVAD